jgi:hypothetical protein
MKKNIILFPEILDLKYGRPNMQLLELEYAGYLLQLSAEHDWRLGSMVSGNCEMLSLTRGRINILSYSYRFRTSESHVGFQRSLANLHARTFGL